VELWKGEDFDVAVVDHVLPDGSGAELAEQFLAQKPLVRMVVTSGMTEDNVEVPGGAMFLGKPFTAAQLHALICAGSNVECR
jgi:DNA-binding response OmpR family regulator